MAKLQAAGDLARREASLTNAEGEVVAVAVEGEVVRPMKTCEADSSVRSPIASAPDSHRRSSLCTRPSTCVAAGPPPVQLRLEVSPQTRHMALAYSNPDKTCICMLA